MQVFVVVISVLCAPSTADLERTFSSDGLVLSAIRNILGNEKQ